MCMCVRVDEAGREKIKSRKIDVYIKIKKLCILGTFKRPKD